MLTKLERERRDWFKRKRKLAAGKYEKVKTSPSAMKLFTQLRQIEADIATLDEDIARLDEKEARSIQAVPNADAG